MDKETAVNKMGTAAVPKVMLNMGKGDWVIAGRCANYILRERTD